MHPADPDSKLRSISDLSATGPDLVRHLSLSGPKRLRRLVRPASADGRQSGAAARFGGCCGKPGWKATRSTWNPWRRHSGMVSRWSRRMHRKGSTSSRDPVSAPPPKGPRYARLAGQEPGVAHVFRILGQPEPLDWYKVWEILEQAIGGKEVADKRGWATKQTSPLHGVSRPSRSQW